MTGRHGAGLFVAVVLSQAVQASAASLADQSGRWSCTPTQPLTPQVEIDFEEREYRRCDQNICSAYDLAEPSARMVTMPDGVRIGFAPDSLFFSDLAGHAYTEILQRGATRHIATGTCLYRDNSAPPGGGQRPLVR